MSKRYPRGPKPTIKPKTPPKKSELTTSTDLSDSKSLLYEILCMKRPAGSATEKMMINRFIKPLNPIPDNFGNQVITVKRPDGKSSDTLFSCHTDTVHHTDGIQKIYLDTKLQEVFVEEDCLGADDGTGIYIMLTMIKNKVPGTYVFHRAEEVGCQGSLYIANNFPKWLKTFKRAIAFDRKGQNEVIIAQSVGIIASDTFGDALAVALNDKTGLNFRTSKLGTVTDTAKYHMYIPECINLSVGYQRQHTSGETQSISFLKDFIPALLAVKWDELPTARKAGPAASKYPTSQRRSNGYSNNNYYSGGYGGGGGWQNQVPNNTYSIDELVPKKKLAQIIMRNPRVALALLDELEPTVGDLFEAEYDVENEDFFNGTMFPT